MGRKRVSPKLHITKGKYYCTDIYLPNGKRSIIGFATTENRTAGKIMIAFEKWLDRRSMATQAWAALGTETAKILLEHTSTSTTETYLLEEVQEAMNVAKFFFT